jgi:hypothetical protein
VLLVLIIAADILVARESQVTYTSRHGNIELLNIKAVLAFEASEMYKTHSVIGRRPDSLQSKP